MTTYAIAGVSGHTGQAAADALLQQKHDVRVIVRDAAKGKVWADKGASVAVADLNDSIAVGRALQGVDGAYFLVPPSGADDPMSEQRALIEKLAGAAKGLKHVVLLSSVGAQHADGTGPIRVLHQAEAIFARAVANVTFLRAAYFMENLGSSFAAFAHGILPSFLPKDLAFPMVAAADIGRTAASLLVEGGKGQQIVELCDKQPYAMTDVARVASAKLNKPIVVQEAPLTAVVATLTGYGMKPAQAELYREMFEGIINGRVAFDRKGRTVDAPTSLDTFLNAAL